MSQEKTSANQRKKRSLSLADIKTTFKVGRRSTLSILGGAIVGTTGLMHPKGAAVAADADIELSGDPAGSGSDIDKGPKSDEIGSGTDTDETVFADPSDQDEGDPAGEGSDLDSGVTQDLTGGGTDEDTGPERDPVGGGSDADFGDPVKQSELTQSDPIDTDSGRFADPGDSD